VLKRSALAAVLGVAALQTRPALAQPSDWLLVYGGLGASFTLVEGANGTGSGGYVAAEAFHLVEEWFTPRAYLGLLLTWPENDCGPGVVPCEIWARIFFLGIKGRLMAPIPWVGPFIEAGVGLSLGTLTTRNGAIVEAAARGVIPHVQWAVGLAIGPRHDVSLSLQYLEHTRGKQTGAALAAGFAFQL